MTEQQTLDREKKIAEIRDVVEHRRSHSYYEMVYNENHEKYIRFLLDELERLEREYAEECAAHNAHVAELCELEKENRRLREDIEKIIKILKNGQQAHWQTFKIRQLLEVPLE